MKTFPALTFRLIAFAVVSLAGLGESNAASYYLQTSIADPNTLNTLVMWWDQPSGGGNHPTTLAGNDFYSNGLTVRTGTGSSTFGDATTNLFLNSRFLVRTSGASATTVPNLTTYAGAATANIAAGVGSIVLDVTNFTNDVTTNFTSDGNATGRTQAISIGTLTGSGDFSLTQRVTLNLTITTGIAFTGNITWGDANIATLNFNNDVITSGGLIALSTSRIVLDQNVTFASVSLDGTSLAAGTYDYNYLNTNFDAIFVDGGSGSITVAAIPEPKTYAMLALFVMAAHLFRRGHARRET